MADVVASQSIERDRYVAWLEALAGFIMDAGSFPHPNDPLEAGRYTPRDEVLQSLHRSLDRAKHPSWLSDEQCAIHADTLALFTHRLEALRDVMASIGWGDAGLSRGAAFDPLTYLGLSQVENLVDNGVYDDMWVAHYRGRDGDQRVVGEAVDDEVRWKRRLPSPVPAFLDKDEAWFLAAERSRIDPTSFPTLFLSDLTEVEKAPPSRDELYDLWTSRPYVDFGSAAPAP